MNFLMQMNEPWNFLTLFLIVITYFHVLYFLFVLRNNAFLATNIKPEILSLNTLRIRGDPTKIRYVKTGLLIQDFADFDINNNNFILNGILWFKFNPSLISLEKVGDFSFQNARYLKKELTEKIVVGHELFVQYKIQISFSVDLDHRFFPLNDYNLHVVMVNEHVKADEMIFDIKSNGLSLANDLKIEDWRILDTSVESGYANIIIEDNTLCSTSYPRVLFTLRLKKKDLRRLILIIAPILLILFISTAGMLPFDRASTLSISAGCLTGILAYRYVINNSSPNVGYFTLAEHIYHFCLLFVFLSFVLVLYREIHPSALFGKAFGFTWFYGVMISTIVFMSYILFFWEKKLINFRIRSGLTWLLRKPKPEQITVKHLPKYQTYSTMSYFAERHSWQLLLQLMQQYEQIKPEVTNELYLKKSGRCVLISGVKLDHKIILNHFQQLKTLGTISDDFRLQSPNDFIIFNQLNIESFVDSRFLLSLLLLILVKNKAQSFIVSNGLLLHRVFLFNTSLSLTSDELRLIESFFYALPSSIELKYLDNQKERTILVTNDHHESNIIKNPDIIVHYLQPVHFFFVPTGIALAPPTAGAINWIMNSFHRHNPGFAVIEGASSTLSWFAQKSIQDGSYTTEEYSLRYGFNCSQGKKPLFNGQIILNSTMDLSHSSSPIAKKIYQGITTQFTAQNSLGGIGQKALICKVFDDQYNPTFSRQNTLNFIKDKSSPPIIFSPTGTATLEAYADLIRARKLFVLFPISGTPKLRTHEYEHVIFFRPSIVKEGLALLNHATEVKMVSRIAIFFQNDAYGLGAVEGIKPALDKIDIEYLFVSYQRNDLNVSKAAMKINRFNPDGILFFSTNTATIELVNQLDINRLASVALFAVSYAANNLQEFLSSVGLPLTRTHLVPQFNADMELVRNYHHTIQNSLLPVTPSDESLEGYINASLFCHLVQDLQFPYHPKELLEKISTWSQFSYKGLPLHFNPETREIYHDVWINTR